MSYNIEENKMAENALALSIILSKVEIIMLQNQIQANNGTVKELFNYFDNAQVPYDKVSVIKTITELRRQFGYSFSKSIIEQMKNVQIELINNEHLNKPLARDYAKETKDIISTMPSNSAWSSYVGLATVSVFKYNKEIGINNFTEMKKNVENIIGKHHDKYIHNCMNDAHLEVDNQFNYDKNKASKPVYAEKQKVFVKEKKF